ncbi:tRNA(Ile)-lysidine synthase isoform X2 [Medicago truncatula]|uniref:tRNA(Ile)-lysidine synthase isoform X2 n=1 Tax=Medicago truncatula TaxID=3880 RepID=UPI000D2F2D67|nr:tRNA(Ile)-lysidine synthase isoform X2 [Medicago truncatula]
MARGLILLSSPTSLSANTLLSSFSKNPSTSFKLSPFSHLLHLQKPSSVSSPCCFTVCSSSSPSSQQCSIDMAKYRQVFSRRMDMAGIKPHHRIALGVSGGPDSIALCVLTAGWKTAGANSVGTDSSGFIDGLLAIIVDHGLRAESKDEANIVRNRVSQMGIRCEIANCDWPSGKPKQGHLQKAARDMRYQVFHDVCAKHQIGVLFIAHHADDQAELFILRLSRNSGVLGLAGTPFTSQIFPMHTHSYCEVPANGGVLLVRPLLEFSKEDMYKICRGGTEEWVEDPTNQNQLFTRNRIRRELNHLSSSFKSELQRVISACRKTRAYVDHVCHSLIHQAVVIKDLGYAVIDLQILCPSKIEDIYLLKFLSLVLQFVSQRQRQIRGSALKLLMDYLRTIQCKNCITAAGCYLCPDPGSKGSRVLVCCSVDIALPLKMEFSETCSFRQHEYHVANELEKIIEDEKSNSNHLVLDASDVHFLDANPESVLDEAKRLNIISEPTFNSILVLQKQETNRFRSKVGAISDLASKHEVENATSSGNSLQPGQCCYFMDRFMLTWKLNDKMDRDVLSDLVDYGMDLSGEARNFCCTSCVVGRDQVLEVRHMIESDWLYLAELSRYSPLENSANGNTKMMEKTASYLHYASVSAKKALVLLKSIPVAARRSLPVLINQQGKLICIPSVNFKHCPCLMVHVEYKPKIPLGGGHSSFI